MLDFVPETAGRWIPTPCFLPLSQKPEYVAPSRNVKTPTPSSCPSCKETIQKAQRSGHHTYCRCKHIQHRFIGLRCNFQRRRDRKVSYKHACVHRHCGGVRLIASSTYLPFPIVSFSSLPHKCTLAAHPALQPLAIIFVIVYPDIPAQAVSHN